MAGTGTLPFRAPVDLNRNELRNAILQVLSAAPSSPVLGLIYSDSNLDSPYWYSATRGMWVPLDATKATGIPNTALATNPLLRSNHIGTQLASTISNLASTVQDYTLDQFAAPVNPVSMGNLRVTNVATPTASTDAANKAYVDNAVQSSSAGISAKASCVAVSNANIASLSGLTTVVDGVTLSTANMRVLLTGQTTASQNGPWLVQTGAWTRPTTDSNNELETGALWFIEQGGEYAASQWWLNSPGAGTVITPGTTSIGIVQFGASASYSAAVGGGLQLSGSQFSVEVPAGGGIVTDNTGTHVDTTVVVRKYVNAAVGTGSATSITLTHNLGTLAVHVSVINNSTGDIEYVSVNAATTNTIVLTFAVAPAASAYTVVVMG